MRSAARQTALAKPLLPGCERISRGDCGCRHGGLAHVCQCRATRQLYTCKYESPESSAYRYIMRMPQRRCQWRVGSASEATSYDSPRHRHELCTQAVCKDYAVH